MRILNHDNSLVLLLFMFDGLLNRYLKPAQFICYAFILVFEHLELCQQDSFKGVCQDSLRIDDVQFMHAFLDLLQFGHCLAQALALLG